MEKYKISDSDWNNMALVELKMKAQTVSALFLALENTLAPHISPEESESIDQTKGMLLNYLDKMIER